MAKTFEVDWKVEHGEYVGYVKGKERARAGVAMAGIWLEVDGCFVNRGLFSMDAALNIATLKITANDFNSVD